VATTLFERWPGPDERIEDHWSAWPGPDERGAAQNGTVVFRNGEPWGILNNVIYNTAGRLINYTLTITAPSTLNPSDYISFDCDDIEGYYAGMVPPT
jgi:hypothetical protein